jgi:hypothetical protein
MSRCVFSAFRIAAKRGTTMRPIVDTGLSGLWSDLSKSGDHESLATFIIGCLIATTPRA